MLNVGHVRRTPPLVYDYCTGAQYLLLSATDQLTGGDKIADGQQAFLSAYHPQV